MKFSSFKYLVFDGFKNVLKNKLMSFASIGVLTACLALIGSAILFSLNIQKILNNIKSQNEIVVFVKDTITEQEKAGIDKGLDEGSNILSFEYVSKDQALEEQINSMGEASILLDDLKKDNILPASYRIKLKDISHMKEYASFLKSISFVEKVNAPTDVADSLMKIDDMLKIFGTIVISVLVVVSIVIVSNTIKISVFTRRREINIMKYVGATNFFVRLPFVVEGFIIGIISALIAYFTIYFSYNYIIDLFFGSSSILSGSMFNVVISYSSVQNVILLGFLLCGIAAGVLGSIISSRKYLKV